MCLPHPACSLQLTPGNHGRAVAHTARLLGLAAHIFVPSTVEKWSIDAIASEGCPVTLVDADYDGAVEAARRASLELGDKGLFVQDTSFEGYTDIPLVSGNRCRAIPNLLRRGSSAERRGCLSLHPSLPVLISV